MEPSDVFLPSGKSGKRLFLYWYVSSLLRVVCTCNLLCAEMKIAILRTPPRILTHHSYILSCQHKGVLTSHLQQHKCACPSESLALVETISLRPRSCRLTRLRFPSILASRNVISLGSREDHQTQHPQKGPRQRHPHVRAGKLLCVCLSCRHRRKRGPRAFKVLYDYRWRILEPCGQARRDRLALIELRCALSQISFFPDIWRKPRIDYNASVIQTIENFLEARSPGPRQTSNSRRSLGEGGEGGEGGQYITPPRQ